MNRAFFSRLYGFSLQPAVQHESEVIPDVPSTIVITSASILNPTPGSVTVPLSATLTEGTIPVTSYLWTSNVGTLFNATSLNGATISYFSDQPITVTITAYHADSTVAATASKQITLHQLSKVANVLIWWGQSNDSGLSPRSKLTPQYRQVDSRVKSYDYTTNTLNDYEVGVNDQPLTTALVGDSYEDGFGPDVGFLYMLKKDPVNLYQEYFVFKKNTTPPQNTNGATVALWQSTIFPNLLIEWEAFNQVLSGLGYDSVKTLYAFSGLGEGDGSSNAGAGNPNFAADYTALWNRFKTEGIAQDDTILYLAEKVLYPNIAASQQQIVDSGVAAALIKTPFETFLVDNLHKSCENMIRLGKLEYSAISDGFNDNDDSEQRLISQQHGSEFFNQGDGIYISTDSGSNGWSSTLFDKFLAQGFEGGIYVKYDTSISSKSGWLGLMAANTLPTIEPDGVALFKIENGVIVVKRNGTTTVTTVPTVSGRYYQVGRNDSNQLVIKESVNETSWTEVYSFGATSGAKLYTVGSVQGIFGGGDKSTLVTPRHVGLTV